MSIFTNPCSGFGAGLNRDRVQHTFSIHPAPAYVPGITQFWNLTENVFHGQGPISGPNVIAGAGQYPTLRKT